MPSQGPRAQVLPRPDLLPSGHLAPAPTPDAGACPLLELRGLQRGRRVRSIQWGWDPTQAARPSSSGPPCKASTCCPPGWVPVTSEGSRPAFWTKSSPGPLRLCPATPNLTQSRPWPHTPRGQNGNCPQLASHPQPLYPTRLASPRQGALRWGWEWEAGSTERCQGALDSQTVPQLMTWTAGHNPSPGPPAHAETPTHLHL